MNQKTRTVSLSPLPETLADRDRLTSVAPATFGSADKPVPVSPVSLSVVAKILSEGRRPFAAATKGIAGSHKLCCVPSRP
jgi:hypothetical protein